MASSASTWDNPGMFGFILPQGLPTFFCQSEAIGRRSVFLFAGVSRYEWGLMYSLEYVPRCHRMFIQ